MGGGFNISRQRSDSYSRPVNVTPADLNSMRATTFEGLSSIIKSGGGKKYTGPFVAPLTGSEATTLLNLDAMMENPGENWDLAAAMIGDTLRGDYLDPESNPFLMDYVKAAQRRVTEAYDQDERERRQMFARAGHRLPESSPFATAQGIADRGRIEALSDTATNILEPAYEAERVNQLQASQINLDYINSRWQSALENLQAQALPRLVEQYGIDQAYNEFVRRQNALLAALQIAAGVTVPIFGSESESTGRGIGWGISGGMSGGAQAALASRDTSSTENR